ncbi:MAG TPA: DEAD/DEAH box helicase, partial [Bradyrhizobium sp.]|nr:DEAD/DEAH box helicase [Bradyrhizobium sp.]
VATGTPGDASDRQAPMPNRAEPAASRRDSASEPADHSHLPAFLLRPVRARI